MTDDFNIKHKIIVGGTFDKIHKGHEALLNKAIELAQLYNGLLVVIVTADYLRPFKSHPIRDYKDRVEDIRQYIISKPYHPLFTFFEYSSTWTEDVWKIFEGKETQITLVCSEETYIGALEVNRQLRDANKYNDDGETYNQVTIVVVPIVIAEDGQRISSSRIHKKEIDLNGNKIIDTDCS